MKCSVSAFRRFASLLVLTLLIASSALQGQGFKWWRDESVQRKLGLTPEQTRRIDDVFQNALPELRRAKRGLDDLERELSRQVESTDDAGLLQQVDRVEAARAVLNKARTVMLLRIRRVLTADQRVKFEALDQARKRLKDHRH